MDDATPFVDIHCHLLPGIDDGAKNWEQSLAMARLAVEDGIGDIIVTPHQLGAFSHNGGDSIRSLTRRLQHLLDHHESPLELAPGGDVRIGPDMIEKLDSGEVLSLADQRRHVLLELPHELYFPIEQVLDQLAEIGMVGVLSHPERNKGLLRQPRLLGPLVDYGCLMQITAGSLLGSFGEASQQLSESMLAEGLVHFVASDAHGVDSRRPLLRGAFERVAQLTDYETADDLFRRHGEAVLDGEEVRPGRRTVSAGFWSIANWLPWRRAG